MRSILERRVTESIFLFLFRESETVFGNRGLQVRTLFQYVGPFCLLWMLTNYSYVRALGVIRAADVTALFSSCNAFVYIFSLIWLQEKLGIVKVRVKCLREPSLFMPGEGEGRARKIHDKTVKKVLTPPPPSPHLSYACIFSVIIHFLISLLPNFLFSPSPLQLA